jgi:hypothetical protein
MSLLTLLNTGAIPFNYPDDDRSIAARRCRSRRLRAQFERETASQTPEQRMLMEEVVNEAILTFQSVLDPRPPRTPRRLVEVAEKATQIRQPPNSPNTAVTFTFEQQQQPIVNDSDGLDEVVKTDSTEVEEEVEEEVPRLLKRGRRSMRKRRRVPSFKNKQTPRVASKFSCQTQSDEADDEASEDEIDLIKLRMARVSTDDSSVTDKNRDIFEASSDIFAARYDILESKDDIVTTSELQLKLQVLSEAQKTVEAVNSETATDWAKVGAELRSIADKFNGLDEDEDEVDESNNVVMRRHQEIDFVSLINLMLPFSVPQSLWSALVSYAAWKIFKRFQ